MPPTSMKRYLSLLAATLFSGCGPPRTTEDLVKLFPEARFEAETAHLDFGTREARSHLVSGWSDEEIATDGTTFVWAKGASSSLRLFIAEPRPLEMRFRSWPFRFPGAPAQVLKLSLNGTPFSELTLEDVPAEYRVAVPATHQVEGDNTLDIDYAYHRSPGASDPRSLSAGWDWLRIEGALPTPGSIARGDALALPYGARVEYLLDLPAGGRLAIDGVRPWGSEGANPHLALSLQTVSRRENRDVAGSSRGIEISLDEGLVALSLQARTGGGRFDGEGGLLVRRPVVSHEGSPTPRSASPGARPNVILIVIDTLRADHLGAYGYEKRTSPNIDLFGKDSTVFENAFAQSSWTKPSVASLLTGLLPRSHTANRREDALPDEALSLAERLLALGYRTVGFVTNTNVASEFGFAQGFETYELLLDPDERLGYARAGVLVSRALAWLADERRGPFFLYLHATDPHDPYTFTPGGKETVGSTDFMEALEAFDTPSTPALQKELLDLYDEKIRYADGELGKLFDKLRDSGLYERSLIVLVSDHGEEFFEHGWWRHGKTLYQEQLHVPFVVKWPQGTKARGRMSAVVQHVDLVPTVLDVLGEPKASDLPGRSLAASADGDPIVWSYLRSDGREVESVIYRGRKLLRTFVYDREAPAFALFDLTRDSGETRNVLETERPAFDLLDALLRRPVEGLTPVPAAIDETTRRRLEALGYIR